MRPKKTAKTLTAIIISLAIIALVATGCHRPNYHEVLTEDPVRVTKLARALVETYHGNPVRFTTEYAGETIRAIGVITTIARDGSVTFEKPSVCTYQITCQFQTKEEVARLDQGQKITFTGQIHDVRNRTAYLNNCSRQ